MLLQTIVNLQSQYRNDEQNKSVNVSPRRSLV
jgi:hypothetical protein